MLRLRVSAEGRMVKIGAFAHSRLEPLHALLRGAAPQQMCRSATCPELLRFLGRLLLPRVDSVLMQASEKPQQVQACRLPAQHLLYPWIS
jgi:hypothetical protein